LLSAIAHSFALLAIYIHHLHYHHLPQDVSTTPGSPSHLRGEKDCTGWSFVPTRQRSIRKDPILLESANGRTITTHSSIQIYYTDHRVGFLAKGLLDDLLGQQFGIGQSLSFD
jgi:hypothetical protein